MQRENYYKANNYFSSKLLRDDYDYLLSIRKDAESKGIEWRGKDFLSVIEAIAAFDHNQMIDLHVNEVSKYYNHDVEAAEVLIQETLIVSTTLYQTSVDKVKSLYQKFSWRWKNKNLFEEALLSDHEVYNGQL